MLLVVVTSFTISTLWLDSCFYHANLILSVSFFLNNATTAVLGDCVDPFLNFFLFSARLHSWFSVLFWLLGPVSLPPSHLVLGHLAGHFTNGLASISLNPLSVISFRWSYLVYFIVQMIIQLDCLSSLSWFQSHPIFEIENSLKFLGRPSSYTISFECFCQCS